MSFIDDGLRKQKEIAEHAALLAEHREKIFLGLWDKVNAYVAEAKNKGFQLRTNGSLHDRVVIVERSGDIRKEKLALTLDERLNAIHAKSDRWTAALIFTMEVCPDGVVCLKFNDVKVETDAAAVLILKPLLFPDLTWDAAADATASGS